MKSVAWATGRCERRGRLGEKERGKRRDRRRSRVILSAAQRSEGPLCAEVELLVLLGAQGSFVAPLLRMTRGAPQLNGAYLNATIPAPMPSVLKFAERCGSTGPTFTVCVFTTAPVLSRKSIFSVYDFAASVWFMMLPPSVVFASPGVNSLKVTRAGI